MPRSIAVSILKEVVKDKHNLSDSLLKYKTHSDFPLISEFCYGVCRHYYALRSILCSMLDKPFKAKDLDVELSIILGLYQLEFMSIKPFAAVNETVKLSKALKKSWAKGVINALLRRYQREKDSIMAGLENDEAYQLNHPTWFIKKLKAASYDVDTICQANDKRPPIYLRVNLKKISPDAYLKLLHDQNIDAALCSYTDKTIVVNSKINVPELPGFDKGYVFVQDLAAQLSTQLLGLSDNLSVLDACSAPGGKLTAILETSYNLKRVVGIDSNERRVLKIHQNLERLELSAEVLTLDACQANEHFQDQKFDRILLDAPCSALGVIRRHPDIKLLRSPNEVREAVARQKMLLESLWALLAPGGRLVYATCSVLPEENDEQVIAFLKAHSDAKPADFQLPVGNAKQVGWQIEPGEADGFYYAIIERSKQPSLA